MFTFPLKAAFFVSTLVVPAHGKVPCTEYTGRRGGGREGGKTGRTQNTRLQASSNMVSIPFSSINRARDNIHFRRGHFFELNCNLTVNKTHVILPSHMFTVHAGTSGYLPSSKISYFLDGFTFRQGQTFSGPHQACSPSPSFMSSPPGRRTDVSWDTRYGGNSQEMISHVTTCSLALGVKPTAL